MRKSKPTRQQLARRVNATERRRRIIAEGGRQINVLLDRTTAECLDALLAHTGETKQVLFARLLADETERRL